MLRGKIYCFIVFCIFAVFLVACSGGSKQNVAENNNTNSDTQITSSNMEAAVPETQQAGSNIHGMLTRVVYGDNVAYIFGSMHEGKPDWFPLHPIVQDAMARSDAFAFEVDLSETPSDELLAEIDSLISIPDGLTLEDILPEDVFVNFITNLETFNVIGLHYDNIADLSPVVLMFAVLPPVMVELLGTEAELSVDSYVAAFAEAHGKPIIGLAGILDENFAYFSMPMEAQVYALVDFPDFDTMLANYADTSVIEAYARQDIDALKTAISAIYPAGNPYQDYLRHISWHTRSNRFADEIARLLQETEEPTNFFVTIGISHILGGDFGNVLNRLEDMGFNVVPLWK